MGDEPAGVRRAAICDNGSVLAKSPGRAVHGIFSATFSDPTNERLIYLAAAGLVLIGVALLVGTVVWWHRGRQEHPALAPLEVMSSHTWERAPEAERRRLLNNVRINGEPLPAAEVVRPDAVDLEALVRSTPQAFDDLFEPGLGWSSVAPVEEAPHVFEVNASGEVEEIEPSEAAQEAEPEAGEVPVDDTAVEAPAANEEREVEAAADEPDAETVAEPEVEPAVEPVAEAEAEPVVDAAAEPDAEQLAEVEAEAQSSVT